MYHYATLPFSRNFVLSTRPRPRSLFFAPPELGSDCLNNKLCMSPSGVLLEVASTMIASIMLPRNFVDHFSHGCWLSRSSPEQYDYQISLVSFTEQC